MSRYIAWDSRLRRDGQTTIFGNPIHIYGPRTPLSTLVEHVDRYFNHHGRSLVELDIWCHGRDICQEGIYLSSISLLQPLRDELMFLCLRGCEAAVYDFGAEVCRNIANNLHTCVIAANADQVGTCRIVSGAVEVIDVQWEGLTNIYFPPSATGPSRMGFFSPSHSRVRQVCIDFMSSYVPI